jgi:hypothetical protein
MQQVLAMPRFERRTPLRRRKPWQAISSSSTGWSSTSRPWLQCVKRSEAKSHNVTTVVATTKE